MVICHFRIRIVKGEKISINLKNSARKAFFFWPLCSTGKNILRPREEKSWTTMA